MINKSNKVGDFVDEHNNLEQLVYKVFELGRLEKKIIVLLSDMQNGSISAILRDIPIDEIDDEIRRLKDVIQKLEKEQNK